jgi:hypothetical protein
MQPVLLFMGTVSAPASSERDGAMQNEDFAPFVVGIPFLFSLSLCCTDALHPTLTAGATSAAAHRGVFLGVFRILID